MPYIMNDPIVAERLHFFFLLDISDSMKEAWSQTLNRAMDEILRKLAKQSEEQEIIPMIHLMAFDSSVRWLLGTEPTQGIPAENLHWQNIATGSGTDTAGAIRSLIASKALRRVNLGHPAYRPIIILISDGYSDNDAETQKAIQELIDCQISLRIVFSVPNYNAAELEAFASEADVVYVDRDDNETSPTHQKLIFERTEYIIFGSLILMNTNPTIQTLYLFQENLSGINSTENIY